MQGFFIATRKNFNDNNEKKLNNQYKWENIYDYRLEI